MKKAIPYLLLLFFFIVALFAKRCRDKQAAAPATKPVTKEHPSGVDVM